MRRELVSVQVFGKELDVLTRRFVGEVPTEMKWFREIFTWMPRRRFSLRISVERLRLRYVVFTF